eukprot:483794-Prorocentrum_minimum.AAC.1
MAASSPSPHLGAGHESSAAEEWCGMDSRGSTRKAVGQRCSIPPIRPSGRRDGLPKSTRSERLEGNLGLRRNKQ